MMNKLKAFMQAYRGETVVCAVSGGADSMALLWGLYLLKDKLELNLSAAHFNHGLRGGESDRDEAFVRDFCAGYGIPCITHAKKPTGKGIRECLELFGMPPEECALVGDQIFTDTLGANCAGVRSILVRPIHNHNFWLKARHVLEKPFIFCARKRRIKL